MTCPKSLVWSTQPPWVPLEQFLSSWAEAEQKPACTVC